MRLTSYLDDTIVLPSIHGLEKSESIYGRTSNLFDTKEKFDRGTLAIIGVNESRNSRNPGASNSADAIRFYLYSLSGTILKVPLVDCGNLKTTSSPADTYMALRDVVSFLVEKGATCLILGGTQELTWPIYQAIAEHESRVSLSFIDQTLDMGSDNQDFSSTGYINRFLQESPDNLFSLSLLGFQGYLTSSKKLDSFLKSKHEAIRLGAVRGSMSELEPIFRDSHIISMDISAIRQSDAPGVINPSPNGLYPEEACQMARFAGFSTKVKAFGVFELSTLSDNNGQTAHLAAQIVWHFIEAFNSPSKIAYQTALKNVKRFYVNSPMKDVDLVFLKNDETETWWMEFPPSEKTNGMPMICACSFNDYLQASNGEIPERWLRISSKVM